MSIWSHHETIEPLYPVRYAFHESPSPIPGAELDLSTVNSWYGEVGLRLTLNGEDGEEVQVVIHRDQIAELRDALTHWLEHG